MRKIKETQASAQADKNSVALKAFFAIAQKWHLSVEQECVLLGVPKPTFYRWKREKNGALSRDQLERISYLLGIYKSLKILLPSEKAVNEWIHKPNSAAIFAGKSALDKLMQGRVIDLADVRRYLDAERGW